MSKYIKIECCASLSYEGCEAIDVYTTDITHDEWSKMNESERDDIINGYLDSHLERYLDTWAEVV